jgi:hypothetical protein
LERQKLFLIKKKAQVIAKKNKSKTSFIDDKVIVNGAQESYQYRQKDITFTSVGS